jgi:eukaryotic-like serine/threonine-protein kinase
MPPMTPEQMSEVLRLWDQADSDDEQVRAAALAQLGERDPMLRRVAIERDASEDADGGYLSANPVVERLRQRSVGALLGTGDIVGPYQLVEEIGRGGMATVWRAERADGFVRRPLALKLPHAWLSEPMFAQRFEREREILGALTHPHIARLYDAGVTPAGQPYLAMEYVQGLPITAHCQKFALDLRQRLELFSQVLAAVQYAHEHQVVHRDLKPSNILVSEDGNAHLLDFGIAKLLDDAEASALTQNGQGALTPRYASPEQIAGQVVGAQSDVYSLGVLFYELVCEQLPYSVERPTRAAMEEAILNAEIAKPSTRVQVRSDSPDGRRAARRLRARLRGDIDTIALTALQRQQQRRFASAQAFADDLRRHLAGQRVLSRPDSLPYRVTHFVQRHWVGVGATTLVFASLGTGMGLALSSARHAQQESRTAEATLAFVTALFESNEPKPGSEQKAGDITARQLLDEGAKRIETTLKDEPLTRLRIYKTLGGLYVQLNEYEQARRIHKQWIDLARTMPGRENRELISALQALADMPMNYAPDHEAISAAREAIELLTRIDPQKPEDRWDLGATENTLSVVLETVDLAQSRTHAQRAVELLRDNPNRTDFAGNLNQLAALQIFSLQYVPAVKVLDEALSVLPDDKVPKRLEALKLRCVAHMYLGQLLQAERDCRQAVEITARIGGAGTVNGAVWVRDLSQVLMRSARPALASQVLSAEADAVQQRNRPEGLPALYDLYCHLAEAALAQGRLQEAETWLAKLAPMDDTMSTSQLLRFSRAFPTIRLLIERGQDAQPEIKAMLTLDQKTKSAFGSKAERLHWLAIKQEIYLRHFDAAMAQLEKLKAAAAESPDTPPLPPLGTRALEQDLLRAELHVGMGDLDRAQAAVTEIQSRIQTSENPDLLVLHTQQAEWLLGKILLRRTQAAEAEQQLLKAQSMSRAWLDPSSPQSAALLTDLARSRWLQRDRASALTLAQQARAVLQHTGDVAPYYTEPLAELERDLAAPRAISAR